MSVAILFKDQASTTYNPLNKPVKIVKAIDTTANYVLVCPQNTCVHVENLFTYIEQEERANRISPNTDVVLVCKEDPETFILTQTASRNAGIAFDSHIVKTWGTGIIQVESRLSKTHPQYKTIVICDQSKRDQMIQELEAAKEAERAQIQKLRAMLYNSQSV
jgi:hypothetical protein